MLFILFEHICKIILPLDINLIHLVFNDSTAPFLVLSEELFEIYLLFSTLSLAMTSVTEWQRASKIYFTDKIVHFILLFLTLLRQGHYEPLISLPKGSFSWKGGARDLDLVCHSCFLQGYKNTGRYYFRRHVELICCLFSFENGLFPHLYFGKMSSSLECTGNHHIRHQNSIK